MSSRDPSRPSADYAAMADHWSLVDDIMGGAQAMRAAVERYLPRFEEESRADYDRRVQIAPFTPLYDGSFRNLASKPFSKEVRISEDAPEALKALVEDIDAAGNHMHVVARDLFKGAINYGLEWLLVDYPATAPGMTLAEERAQRIRPHWSRIPAQNMLAVYEGRIGGETRIIHARISEAETTRDGFEESTVQRIRVLDHDEEGARWSLWEKQLGEWAEVDGGTFSIGRLPLVALFTGDRGGNGFAVRPPLRDLAHMQVTEFQMEANLAYVQTNTAFPSHVFQGVEAPEDEHGKPQRVTVGPREVFFFPAQDGRFGDYKQVEPSGAAAASLRQDLEIHRREMREAGMQPLLPQSGALTATATAVAEAKAHSAVEAWALALKDTLEQAWVYTCLWMGLSEGEAPDVFVHTDFAAGEKPAEEMAVVDKLFERELISGDQYVEEALRRGVLSPAYDREADEARILAAAEAAEADILDALPSDPALA